MPPSTRHAECPKCRASEFELRLLKEEGLGVAMCIKCSSNFLLLDSEDYWFDVIQKSYPRVRRCPCKNTNFQLRFEYTFRDDGDVKHVKVWSACSSCKKTNREMTLDIDYSPTERLVSDPLVFCKTPKILYELRELTLFVTEVDVARILQHFHTVERCEVTSCVLTDDEWTIKKLTAASVRQLVTEKPNYRYIYVTPNRRDVPQSLMDSRAEGVYWKRHEIIRISPPTNMAFSAPGAGLSAASSSLISGYINGKLYYINFSTEFVENEKAVAKSKAFVELAARLLSWLQTEFVSWRGPGCFDNPTEHSRLFGDRYQKQKGR